MVSRRVREPVGLNAPVLAVRDALEFRVILTQGLLVFLDRTMQGDSYQDFLKDPGTGGLTQGRLIFCDRTTWGDSYREILKYPGTGIWDGNLIKDPGTGSASDLWISKKSAGGVGQIQREV